MPGHGLGQAGHEPTVTECAPRAQCDRGDELLPPPCECVHAGAQAESGHLLRKYPFAAEVVRPREDFPVLEHGQGGA